MSDRTCAVWKFEVPMPTTTGRAFIDMPATAAPLSVGLQDDRLVVWALVDPTEPKGTHRLVIANTGQEIPEFPDSFRFLGTVTTSNEIVWHVWARDFS